MKANPGLFHFLKLFYTKQLVASGFVSKSSLTELPFSGFFSPFIPKQFSSFLSFQNSLQNRQVETLTTAEVTTEHCGCVQRREQPAQRDGSTASPPPRHGALPSLSAILGRRLPRGGFSFATIFFFFFFFFPHRRVSCPSFPSSRTRSPRLVSVFCFFFFFRLQHVVQNFPSPPPRASDDCFRVTVEAPPRSLLNACTPLI